MSFHRENLANQNFYAVNSSEEAFLHPNVSMLNVETVDKVSSILEDVLVASNVHKHQSSGDHTMEDTSNNVLSRTLSDHILELTEKESFSEISQRMNDAKEIDFVKPTNTLVTSQEHIDAGNTTFIEQTFEQQWPCNVTMHTQEQQLALPMEAMDYYYGNELTHALRDFVPGYIEGGTDASVFVDTNQRNTLVTSPELIEAGSSSNVVYTVNTTFIEQTFEQQWPPNVTMHTQEQQLALPMEAIDYYYGNELTHALRDFVPGYIEGETDASVFVDTNQINSWNVLGEQQTMDSPERSLRRQGKQPMVETGRKSKSPLSSLGLVGKEIGGQSNPMIVSTQKDKPKGTIEQTFEQQWPCNVTMHTQEEQLALPNEAIDYYYGNELTHALRDFVPGYIEGGTDASVFVDTNQINSWNVLGEQQTMDSPERSLRRQGKQPMVETGRKRKSPLSSLGLVGKEIGGQSNPMVVSTQKDKPKGIFLKNIHNYHATNIELLCCHFNTQGEFLAIGGHDNKVMILDLGNNNFSAREGHFQDITDIRFRPNSTIFATSSLDKTIKIWDAAEPTKTYGSLEGHYGSLEGHYGHVMSVDYHPIMVNILTSCDHNNEIRLWNVNWGGSLLTLKGGSKQVRFQPQLGNLLASSTQNIINIFDIETQTLQNTLQGHDGNILSMCWDTTGYYMASVSEDRARIWSVREGICVFELLSGVNKFQSCVYHPGHILALVIGTNKFLELWNPMCNKNITSSFCAHEGVISSLADSRAKGTIASVSHDGWMKIWS